MKRSLPMTGIAIVAATACAAAAWQPPIPVSTMVKPQEAQMASSRANKHRIAEGEWRLTHIDDTPMSEDTPLRVTFEGPHAVFFGGCNTIKTIAFFKIDSFRFDVQGMTEKACDDEVMEVEQKLIEVLGRVHRLSVRTPGALAFYDHGNTLILAATRV